MSAIRKYVCPRCDGLHDSMTAAENCCPSIAYVAWVCSSCGTDFDSEEYASACCPEVESQSDPYHATVSARELEAAGQQRMSF